MDKVYDSPVEVVKDIPDGAIIMIGGWAASGVPTNLISALRDHGARNLTIIANTPDIERWVDTNILIENKQVKQIICSIVFPLTRAELASAAGEIAIDLVPQGTLAERIRAAGCGLGGFYTPTGAGTLVAIDKETRIINGKEYILELPLRADYALIRAYKADKFGNLVYRGVMRNFNAVMAMAADVTIVQVEEVVEPGELDPNIIATPQVFVDRIVKIPKEEIM
jgi:3-oxoacid CoA-transferase subunit A